MSISLEALRDRRDQLAASLARVDDLRPGFPTARFPECGKPNCHCAQRDSPGHRPSYSRTHRLAEKATRSESWAIPSLLRVTPSATSEHLPGALYCVQLPPAVAHTVVGASEASQAGLGALPANGPTPRARSAARTDQPRRCLPGTLEHDI
jgi:hypothetical protein